MPRSFLSRSFFRGVLVGAMLSALVCFGLIRALDRPDYVDLSGLVLADSASHPDSRMNNRLSLVEAELTEPVYIKSKTIDINDLYDLTNQSVQLRGEFRTLSLTTGESVRDKRSARGQYL